MPVNPEDMIQLLMKTNADQEERLKEKDQTVSDLRATIEELRNTVTDLRSTIANLNETLDEFKRKFFGTSSEKVKKERSGDPPEQDTDPGKEAVVVKEHTRTRKRNQYVTTCMHYSPSGISNVMCRDRNVFVRTVMHLWNILGIKLSVRN